jgi:heme oxygenase (mycobilin-producing)
MLKKGADLMILALSRFKVANGLEDSVARAFLDRPRLVEQAEGFLGMEVFTDRSDASIFYLSTRWTTESAFRQWHASPAHHASHRGIPKGLKLDPTFTELVILEALCS